MMDYKLIAAVVLVVVFAYRTVINLLDWRSMKNPVPDNVNDGFALLLIVSVEYALKVLARENYANLSPDPIVVALEYSHPTLSDRIKAIQQQGSACD